MRSWYVIRVIAVMSFLMVPSAYAVSIQSVKHEKPTQLMRTIAVRVISEEPELAYEAEVSAAKKMDKKSDAQFIPWSSLSLSSTSKPVRVEEVLKEKAIEGVLTLSFLDKAVEEVVDYVPVTVQSQTTTKTRSGNRPSTAKPTSSTSTTTTTVYMPQTREITVIKYKADLEDVSRHPLWTAFLVARGGTERSMLEWIAAKTIKSLKKQKYIVK